MLNNLVSVFLGCIHEFVMPEYWGITDAVACPVFCAILLIFPCALTCELARLLSAIITHDTK